jgi:amino acid transporter
VIFFDAPIPWWSWPLAFFIMAVMTFWGFYRYKWFPEAQWFALIGMVLLAITLALIAWHWTPSLNRP